MARHALWRAHPDDPKSPLGWLVADDRAGGFTPAAAALTSTLIAAATFVWWSVLSGPTPWSLLPLALIGVVLLNLRRSPRRSDLSALVTSPPPGQAFECRIEIQADKDPSGGGTVLGIDQGIVTFVEGWLHYAGRRTEFALRRSDLTRLESAGGRTSMSLPDGRLLVVELRSEHDADLAERTFRHWDTRRISPAGESVLPPAAVHPSGIARAWRGALLAVGWILFLALSLMAVWRAMPVFVFWWWGGGTLVAFRRLVRLRRLAHEERRARLEGRTA